MVVWVDEQTHYFRISNVDQAANLSVIVQGVDLTFRDDARLSFHRATLVPDFNYLWRVERCTRDFCCANDDLEQALGLVDCSFLYSSHGRRSHFSNRVRAV